MAEKKNLTPVEEKYAKYFANPDVKEIKEDKDGKVIAIVMKDGRNLSPRAFASLSGLKKPAKQISIEDISKPSTDLSKPEEKIKDEKKKQKEIRRTIKDVKNQGKDEIKKEKEKLKKAAEAKKLSDEKLKTQKMLFDLAKKQSELKNIQELHKQNAISREQAQAVQDFYNEQALAEQQAELNIDRIRFAEMQDETKHKQFNLDASKQKIALALAKSQIVTRQNTIEKEVERLEKRKSISEEEQKYLKDLQKEQKNLQALQETLNSSEMNLQTRKAVLNSQIKAIENQQTLVGLKIDKLLPDNMSVGTQLSIEGFEDMIKEYGLDEKTRNKYKGLIEDWKELQLEKDGLKKQRDLLNNENRKKRKEEKLTQVVVEPITPQFTENPQPVIDENAQPLIDEDIIEYIPDQNISEFSDYTPEQTTEVNLNSQPPINTPNTPGNLNNPSNPNNPDSDPTHSASQQQTPPVSPVTEVLNPNNNQPEQAHPQETAPAGKPQEDKKPDKKEEKKEDKKEMKTAKTLEPRALTVDEHTAFFMLFVFATILSIIFGLPIISFAALGVYGLAAITITRPWVPTKKKWEEHKKKQFEKKAAKQLARDKQREKIVERTNQRMPEIDKIKKQKLEKNKEIQQQKATIKNLKKQKANLKKSKDTSVKDMQIEALSRKIDIEENKLKSLKTQEKSLKKQSHLLYTEEKADKKIKKTVKKENKKLNALDEAALENYSLEQGAEIAIERTKLAELKQNHERLKEKESFELSEMTKQGEATRIQQEQILVDRKNTLNEIAKIAQKAGIDIQKNKDGDFVPVSTNAEFEEKAAPLYEDIKRFDESYEQLSKQLIEGQKEWSRKKQKYELQREVREQEIEVQKERLKAVKQNSKDESEKFLAEIKEKQSSRDENLARFSKNKKKSQELSQPVQQAVDHRIEMPKLKTDDTTLEQTVLDNIPLDDTNVNDIVSFEYSTNPLEVPPMPGFENFTLSDEELTPRTDLFEPVDENKKKKTKNNNKTKNDGKGK